MTQQKFIESLASETGYSQKEVRRILDIFTGTVTKQVKRGEKVAITGFGTFDLGKRAARRGRNPQTGEIIHIPEMKMPRFRAGKSLKEDVR
ncbi:MAG: HU family DNA-binding protein [Actinomycetota bacterium]